MKCGWCLESEQRPANDQSRARTCECEALCDRIEEKEVSCRSGMVCEADGGEDGSESMSKQKDLQTAEGRGSRSAKITSCWKVTVTCKAQPRFLTRDVRCTTTQPGRTINRQRRDKDKKIKLIYFGGSIESASFSTASPYVA